MDGPPPTHLEELEAQRRAYLAELSDKLTALHTAAAALVRAGWDRPAVESLYQQAHRIAGSSGVYGMAGLSHASGILAERLKDLLESPWPPGSPPGEIATLVAAVRQAARRDSRRRGAGASPIRPRN